MWRVLIRTTVKILNDSRKYWLIHVTVNTKKVSGTEIINCVQGRGDLGQSSG